MFKPELNMSQEHREKAYNWLKGLMAEDTQKFVKCRLMAKTYSWVSDYL